MSNSCNDVAPLPVAFAMPGNSAIDPNCGMRVDADSPRYIDHAGKRYFFCSDGCRDRFNADPEAIRAKGRRREIDKGRTDPVCGMRTDPEHPEHHAEYQGQAYHFCSETCSRKFRSNPERYLGEAPSRRRRTRRPLYTCPMHPEIRQQGPGDCPKCGMALEPMMPERRGR